MGSRVGKPGSSLTCASTSLASGRPPSSAFARAVTEPPANRRAVPGVQVRMLLSALVGVFEKSRAALGSCRKLFLVHTHTRVCVWMVICTSLLCTHAENHEVEPLVLAYARHTNDQCIAKPLGTSSGLVEGGLSSRSSPSPLNEPPF